MTAQVLGKASPMEAPSADWSKPFKFPKTKAEYQRLLKWRTKYVRVADTSMWLQIGTTVAMNIFDQVDGRIRMRLVDGDDDDAQFDRAKNHAWIEVIMPQDVPETD